MDRQKLKFIGALLLMLLLLTSCSHSPRAYIWSPAPTTGQIKMAQASVIISEIKRDRAVEYIQIGETVRIIVCSDALFNPGSANFKETASLDRIARLMLMLETTSAEVAGYTNEKGICPLNRALSKEQAEVVAEYLWSRGLDARILFAKGYGGAYPLSGLREAAINRRIEIRFQYIPYEIGR